MLLVACVSLLSFMGGGTPPDVVPACPPAGHLLRHPFFYLGLSHMVCANPCNCSCLQGCKI